MYLLFCLLLLQIAENIPLISDILEISTLDKEYKYDQVFSKRVKLLEEKYATLRRIRPDGNCFYRAFAYNYLEHLIQHKDKYDAFYEHAVKSKDKLVQLGFPQFTIEDFYDTVKLGFFSKNCKQLKRRLRFYPFSVFRFGKKQKNNKKVNQG